jgi:hypothetical protein
VPFLERVLSDCDYSHAQLVFCPKAYSCMYVIEIAPLAERMYVVERACIGASDRMRALLLRDLVPLMLVGIVGSGTLPTVSNHTEAYTIRTPYSSSQDSIVVACVASSN